MGLPRLVSRAIPALAGPSALPGCPASQPARTRLPFAGPAALRAVPDTANRLLTRSERDVVGETVKTSFYWFAPVDGDARSPGSPTPDHPSTDFEHLKSALQTAERAGFEGALVPFSFRNQTYGVDIAPYIDTWTAAAALGAVTSKIRLLPAILTGVWNPWMMARSAATLDHLTGGRLDLNIITGGRNEPGVTDVVDHDTRYDRTAELIDCARGFWSERRFDYDGRFYQYTAQDCLPKPLQQPEIPLFFSGQSAAARQVARAKRIHTQLLVGDTPETIGSYIQLVKDEATAAGETLTMRFGVRLQVILGRTDNEAWGIAQSMLDSFDREIVQSRIEHMKDVDASSKSRFTALEGRDPFAVESHVLGPNLWAGLRLVRPGASHAIVGSPESVKATLRQYVDAGCGIFVLSGYPNDEAAERFGRDVLSSFERAPVGAG
jgi:alkanesulfonate monooxygenase